MRILNLQLNRQIHSSWQLLHLVEGVVVHLLRLDGVLEELLPLGEHLVVVLVPGELLLLVGNFFI